VARFGFCNGSYTSQSSNVDAEMAMNFYPENPESPGARTAVTLYSTPGKSIAYQLIGPSVRGGIQFQGLCFAVSGATFYQLFANGTATALATIAADNNPVPFAAGPNQIVFVSAGTMYVWNFTISTLTTIPTSTLVRPIVSQVVYLDGFYVATFTGTGQFQVSNPDDATTWPLLDTAIVSVFPDFIVSMVAAYRQIWFFGPKQTAVYYDSGAPIQPFAPVSGGFIETGAGATYASCFMDGSPFWMGADDRGAGVAWRGNAYNPVRVSTFATEFAWAQYPAGVTDAISFTYQEQGHTFWHLYFPSGNATWVYDAASGQWHQRGFWNGGVFTADRARCHFYAFGKHLVGDWNSGNVYQQAINIYSDFGNPIRRVRRAATVGTELEWIYHYQLQVDMEVGLGPIPPLYDGAGKQRAPQVFLHWSDDGAHSWSNQYEKSVGAAGEYTKRVVWRRLGRSRQRTYELSCSDPIPYRIVDAYLKASPAYDTSERYAAQLRKVS
jgi:hypothetical protein